VDDWGRPQRKRASRRAGRGKEEERTSTYEYGVSTELKLISYQETMQ